MATQWQTFLVPLSGGLVTNLSPLQQGVNGVGTASVLRNFEPSLDGGYKKLLGYSKFASTELTGSGVVQTVCVVGESSRQKVIAARSGVYYLLDAVDSVPAWTSLATAADITFTKARHADYKYDNAYKIVFVDGINYPAYYTNSTDTMSYITGSGTGATAVQGASVVEAFKSTLFFGVGTELVFTAPYTDSDFDPANGAGSIGLNSTITGLKVFRDNLIIFCEDKIFNLSGNTSADFRLSPITEELGCIGADTIKEIGGDVMFLAPDGLRTISSTANIGDFGLDVSSKNIRPTVKKLLDSTQTYQAINVREKAQYRFFSYVSADKVATSKGVLGTKFLDQGGQGLQWAELQGFKVYSGDSKIVDNVELVLFANNDGYVYQMENGSSRDGDSIDAVFETPYMPIADPQKRKTFYKLDLYIKPLGTIDIVGSVKYNQASPVKIQPPTFNMTSSSGVAGTYGDTESLYGSAVYGKAFTQTFTQNIVGSGNTVALRIEDNSTSSSFVLDSAVFEFKENDRQ